MELARRNPRSHHPISRVVLGKQARFWPEVHITLHPWPSTAQPQDARVAIWVYPKSYLVKWCTPLAYCTHTHMRACRHLAPFRDLYGSAPDHHHVRLYSWASLPTQSFPMRDSPCTTDGTLPTMRRSEGGTLLVAPRMQHACTVAGAHP